jgi:Transglycosylase-like domain
VRIRIALTTAIAVIALMTTGIFTLSISRQPASAQAATHHTTHTGAKATLSHSALSAFAVPKTPSPTTSTHATTAPASKAAAIPTTAPPAAPVVTPAPAPTPPPPPPPVTDATSVDTGDWLCIRVHESGDQYNSPGAPSGAYGILISTWRSFGYSGWPYEAPASVQDHVALELYARDGWRPWSSRFACGL